MTIVLQRFDETNIAEDRGGFGAVESKYGNLPLKQLAYRASVVALAVRTTILQTYYNPFDQAIEATYIFPIEGQTAVVACEMRVGERVVRAQLKERGQARADYQRAIRAGHRAALLEENRAETFSMRVGNIPPGEAIQVCIETVAQLSLVHGEWTLRLPLVVAPRYTSGLPLPRSVVGSGTSNDTDQVPDASTVTPPTWLPGFASPVDLRLSVDLQMGQLPGSQNWIDRLKSSLHSVVLEAPNDLQNDSKESSCRIDVLPGERVDRDFILRGTIDDSSIRTTLTAEIPDSLTEKSSQPKRTTFAINIVPPRANSQVPRDVVFLLDRSGSMGGWKMKAARRGISRLVDSLLPADRFHLIAFDNHIDTFNSANGKSRAAKTWQDATDANRYEATRWLSKIESDGGTEMSLAIERGLSAYSNGDAEMQATRNRAMVLVTDGQVTGEDSLLRLIGTLPVHARPRLFCLGIDRAVNGSVLQRLAKFTGGTFELVESEKRLDEVLKRFGDEIGSPVVTNLKVDSLASSALQLAPANANTLYSGRSLTIYGQTASTDQIAINISGKLPNGKLWSEQIVAQSSAQSSAQGSVNSKPVLLPLWGKSRVREMEDELASGGDRDPELIRQIIGCSLECSVLSRLTAFVAVDEADVVTDGQKPHSISQPSEFPEGWSRFMPALNRSALISIPGSGVSGTMTSRMSQVSQGSSKEAVDCLLKRGKISQEQLSEAESLSKRLGCTISNSLVKLGYASEEEVARAVAEAFGASYLDVQNLRIDESVIQMLPESVARENGVLPIAASGNTLTVLVSDPRDLETIEKLRFILNRNIVALVGSASAINEAINRNYGEIEGESADSILQEFTDTQIDFTETSGWYSDGAVYSDSYGSAPLRSSVEPIAMDDFSDDDLYSDDPIFCDAPPQNRATGRTRGELSEFSAPDSPEELPSAPVVRLVILMIQEAAQLRASHILLMPKDESFAVVYIIEGETVERDSPPMRLLGAVISRIKILAKLNIADRESLQSGKIAMSVGAEELELTVHVVGKDLLIDMPAADSLTEMPVAVKEWWQLHKTN